MTSAFWCCAQSFATPSVESFGERLHVTLPGSTSAEGEPAAEDLARELRAAGLEVESARYAGAPVAGTEHPVRGGGELEGVHRSPRLATFERSAQGVAVQDLGRGVEAREHGRAVITISPMHLNWAVKFLSDALYADLDELETRHTDLEDVFLRIMQNKT